MTDREKRSTDSVELRATREGDSMVMRLTRGSAEAEREQLEAGGWDVEIVEMDELDDAPA